MANYEDDALTAIIEIGKVGASLFDTVANLEFNQASLIEKENTAIALEEKKAFAKQELQNTKYEDSITKGMFDANNQKISSLMGVANKHTLLVDDMINLNEVVSTDAQSILNDFGVNISSDLEFVFNTGSDINNYRQGLNESLALQQSVITELDTKLNKVNEAVLMGKEIDRSLGLNILDGVADFTDFEQLIQNDPETFGYASYANADENFALTGEMPTQRPDFFMPSEGIGIDENNDGNWISNPNNTPEQNLQYNQEKEIYGQKEYIRKAIMNSVPDITDNDAQIRAWNNILDQSDYTDKDGVEHKSTATIIKEANEAKSAIAANKLLDKAEAAKLKRENDSYDLDVKEKIKNINATMETYTDSKLVKKVLGGFSGKNFKVLEEIATNWSDSPDQAIETEVALVALIGDMILEGIDFDAGIPGFPSTADTNIHLLKLFGGDSKNLGINEDTGAIANSPKMTKQDAYNAWNNMDINKQRMTVNNIYKMINVSAQEKIEGNYNIDPIFGTVMLDNVDPYSTTSIYKPYAQNSDGVNVSQHLNEQTKGYYYNAGIDWTSDENISREDAANYKYSVAKDSNGNVVDVGDPNAVSFTGVRKSVPGDKNFIEGNRVEIQALGLDYGGFFDDDIVNRSLSKNVGNLKMITGALDLWWILARKEKTMNKAWIEELGVNTDYIDEAGLGHEFVYTGN